MERVVALLGGAARPALVLAGVAPGLGLALLRTRLVANLIFGINAADPLALSAAIPVLVAIATWARYLPAWRATRIDPGRVPRAE